MQRMGDISYGDSKLSNKDNCEAGDPYHRDWDTWTRSEIILLLQIPERINTIPVSPKQATHPEGGCDMHLTQSESQTC